VTKSEVCSYIDTLEINGGHFRVKGWMFNKNHPYTEAAVCFESSEGVKRLEVELSERMDVYDAYGNENAKKCGFELDANIKAPSEVRIFIEGVHSNGVDREQLAVACNKSDSFSVSRVVAGYCNFSLFSSEYICGGENIPANFYDNEIDIIIPIYNGFDYLENLFKTVEKTKLKYRLILINDCSTDERVLPYVKNYAQDRTNVVLIDNKENLGFVQSVNKALTLSDKNVALVNSDVIMPDGWLERLMLPILTDSTIASSTPFTNSGTICSFPNFCQDNTIFMGLEVDEVDAVFRHFKPTYTDMPTGVGFCMGMSRQAINRVGCLDAETFYKGYGEENDWCQRAIKLGYRNVHVENLFVYHKHGASFPSEEKKRYIERNLKLLNQMHPNYDKDVQLYCAADPSKFYREFAKWAIMSAKAEKNIIIFDHNWGGGANSYCNIRIKKELEAGYGVIKLTKGSSMYAEYFYGEHKAGFAVNSFDEFDELIKGMSVESIIINELVSYENIYPVHSYIASLKKRLNARLVMLGHDFYSVCPSIYLINNEGKHCFKPELSVCENCIATNKDAFNRNYETIEKWRNAWGTFLEKCDEITVFSENSKSYFTHHYPQLKNIVVKPHTVEYISKIDSYETDKTKTTIGILGNFMRTKGSEVVLEMNRIIKEKSLPAEIVVIGQNLEKQEDKTLKITGRYRVEDIPQIMKDNKIDIIFIASIWPETFSYTTEEVMMMGLPVASFDIGAPAERIRKYDKGLVVSEMTAETALNEIIKFVGK
jgi:GT2 family glycosyltransferase/glycosyltransferase involved in cell wall biosynthesis